MEEKLKNVLTGKPLSKDYLPSYSPEVNFVMSRNRPQFTSMVIQEMLVDPRINFGLWLIKGPILSNARFFIQCDDSKTKEFIINQINRFWRYSAATALSAIEWGYSGSETLYTFRDGLIEYKGLRPLHAKDVQAVTKDGELTGLYLNKGAGTANGILYIGLPKCFWHVHNRQINRWYGRSRLYGAFIPWWEMWSDGGYRDIRSLWFHKNAFDGGTMYHPPGESQLENGGVVSNKDLAREMMEKKKAGGVLALPNIPMGDGKNAWEYEPPTPGQTPDGMLQYGSDLRDEMWEGMCVPPEIAKAEGTGAYAGRRVPQQAFFGILQEISNFLISDFNEQILDPIVKMNMGDRSYEIIPFALLREIDEPEEAATPMGSEPNDGTMMSQLRPTTKFAFGSEEEITDQGFRLAG